MTATKQLAFRELNIIRMPGLTGSIRLGDLGPGVVIVAGPNASGKTTSARVMNYLLWPEAAEQDLARFGFKLHHVSLRSKLAIGDEEWTAGYETGGRIVMRGNAQESALPVPPREHQQRYNLALSQLLTGDDRDFAAWIHREAMGGFDPDRAGRELIRKTGLPTRNLQEYKAWQKASEQVREITKRDHQLRRDQQRLAELIRQRDEAAYKARQIRMFEWVIELRETESRLEEVYGRLNVYPESHGQYHAQLRKTIEEAAETIRQLDTELNELTGDLAGFRREQTDIGLPDGGVPQERMDRLVTLLREIEDFASQSGRLDREIGAADAERRNILKQIDKAGTGLKATADSGSGKAAGADPDAVSDANAGDAAASDSDELVDAVDAAGADAALDAGTGMDADSVLKNGFNPEWVDRASDLVRREAEAENRRLAAESELALLDDGLAEKGADTPGEILSDAPGEKEADSQGGSGGEIPGEKGGDAKGERAVNAADEKAGAKGEKPGATAGDVHKGIDLLTEWLREVGGAQLRGIPPVRAASMLLLSALAAGAMLIEPLAGLLILIPALWLGAEWFRLRKARMDAESGRIPTRFAQSGLDAPKRWDIDAVKDRFLALTESYLPLREMERNRDRRKIIEKKRADAVSELEKIASARVQLAKESGVAPEGVGLPELHFRLHHIHQYNETLTKLARLREERNGCEASRVRLQEEFVALIRDFDDSAAAGSVSVSGSGTGTRDVTSGSGSQRQKDADLFNQAAALSHRDLREQLDRLASRNSRWRELQQQIRGAEDQTAKTEERRKKEQERLEKLYGSLGLQPGDYAGLLKLDEEHGAYQECIQQKQALEQKRDSITNSIREHEGYEPEVEELTREQAGAEVASCRRAEDEAQGLQKEITSIETLLKERIGKQELADALRLEDTARERLAGQFDNYLSDAILSRTVDWLKKENQRRNYPDVFHRANKLFRSFTENRYELEVVQDGGIGGDAGRISSNGGPGFVAIDHVNNGDVYPLDRLSEGTRIQLLLAVRMAFVEQLESGVRVPFFADELLAVSDDARAGAIMDALLAISREGRQVFYFTAQGDEVEKWMQKAAATGDQDLVQVRTLGRGELFRAGGDGLGGGVGEVSGSGLGSGDVGKVVDSRDLEDAEGARDARTSPRWRFGYGSDVPPAEGKTHQKYGEVLDVPSADPMAAGADRLHPWYLAEDTDLIYECLRNGLMTWRQIRLFLDHGGQLAAGEEQIGKMKEAATLAEKALELWQEGRPRPITPSALRDSGAITGAYLERADSLAKRVRFHPVRFLEEVEKGALPRFREDKKAELRAWLDDNGYLPDADPLSDEEVQVRLRALASGFRYLSKDEAERVADRIMRTSAGSQK
ncbi:MAG: hypothetical protein EA363_02370 [Balneolaceae bacterium]|nr:MAG: hypothetical protein EA363_02370 [Balneolaceae bacterium]